MQTEHCVEIRVPLKKGKSGFGSGYTLGPHWVLTARHVLFPDGVDDSKPIEITWWDETARTVKSTESVTRDKITWSNQVHDIALIQCESPYKDVLSAWHLIGQDRPKQWVECKCGGFLSNLHNEEGNQRRKTPTGQLGGYSSQQVTVDIDNLSVSLEKDSYWAGFSGSPVFAGGKLAAVVRSVNVGEHAAGLVASFVCPALDAEGDKEGQGWLRDVPEFLVPPDLWEDRYRELVIKRFKSHKSVCQNIRSVYQRLPVASPITDESDLADALKQMPPLDVIACFIEVLGRTESNDDVEAIEHLARIWLALLVAGQDSIRGIPAFKSDPAAEPLPVNAIALEEVDVEAQVANGEDRDPLLELRGRRLKSPRDLTPGNNMGIDEGDYQAARNAQASNRLKTQPGLEAFAEDEVKEELERFTTEVSGIPLSILPDDEAERGEFITERLRLNNLYAGASVYVRIPAQTDGASALWKLRQWCPELLMFAVSKNESDKERFMNLAGLHQVIFTAKKRLKGDPNTQDGSS